MFQEKIVERRVGKHKSQFIKVGCDFLDISLFLEEHDRSTG